MRIKINRYLTSDIVISLLYRFIRSYSWTLRLKVENEKDWMDYLRNGGSVVLCTWHQQFFSAIRHFQCYRIFNPCIMISESKDGDIIAGVAKRAGWYPVRGSSSRRGSEALKYMIAHVKQSRLAGHILDGPRGPAGKVKAGAIRLAQETDSVLVPFSITAERGWYFNIWDRFLLPKPFSKVFLRFGEMIKLDKVMDEEVFEKQRIRLEEIMLPALKA